MKLAFASKTFTARTFCCIALSGPKTPGAAGFGPYRLAEAQAGCAGAPAGMDFHAGANIGQDYHTGATAGQCNG